MDTHTHARAHTHVHTHVHTRAHTHTRTHTEHQVEDIVVRTMDTSMSIDCIHMMPALS